ncbi:MAG: hypothetical protein IJW00_10615, partial [Clostridia bacterium]|nr:hypothetical protein [Clostridia bacterium]
MMAPFQKVFIYIDYQNGGILTEIEIFSENILQKDKLLFSFFSLFSPRREKSSKRAPLKGEASPLRNPLKVTHAAFSGYRV